MGLSNSLMAQKLPPGAKIGNLIASVALGNGTAKAYGSGHFGEWITDNFGLPAYRYTCDQISDPKAVTPTHPEWRSATDHTHQVGNNRVVAAVSNYGYVQVRQDEGSPKFLNDYLPAEGRYGAGIGFLGDTSTILGTYYPGAAESFDRIFGMGYLRKRVANKKYEVDQVIFAPFGDDPVLMSQVTVTNRSRDRQNPRWVEYWGCQNYQFSYRSGMEAEFVGGPLQTPKLRREFAARFRHHFQTIHAGAGLLETQTFLGRAPKEEQVWQNLEAYRRKDPTAMGPAVPPLPPGASMDDLHPPSTFLVSLDGPVDGFATNAAEFFRGGTEQPAGMSGALNGDLSSTGPDSAFFLERRMALDPGECRTLYFLYGYLPEGFSLDSLQKKYATEPSSQWSRSSAHWKQDGLRFRTDSEPWVERETAWHHYYLRSGLTYDSFFREHILSQGSVYEYLTGFQGAARDPLQNVLSFVFSAPDVVRETIRYTLKEIQPDGSIPYGIVGCGVPIANIYLPSDLELWLLWTASEYVLATRDADFLDEKVPTYPRREASADDLTVRELLARSYKHLTVNIGVGKHGLMRLLKGDWNDAVVVGQVPRPLTAEVRQQAESTLNAAMAGYVLDYYARMLSFTGDAQSAAEARSKAEAQRLAVRKQWTGQWFRRAWLGEHLGWIGEKEMWLEPQPWAIVSGAATTAQSSILVNTINQLVRDPSPIGAMILSKGSAKMERPVGEGENGGIWPSINGTLIWGLAQVSGRAAWDEWKKNSLARHADVYPGIWYGIWSGPDNYSSALSQHPGTTQYAEPNSPDLKARREYSWNYTDFPVMNMDLHSWPLYSSAKLLGLEFQEDGVHFRPDLPLPEYEFTSPLLGLKKSKDGSYSGWYAPLRPGRWKIEIEFPSSEPERKRRIKVNGILEPRVHSERTLRFHGSSEPGKPFRWEIV